MACSATRCATRARVSHARVTPTSSTHLDASLEFGLLGGGGLGVLLGLQLVVLPLLRSRSPQRCVPPAPAPRRRATRPCGRRGRCGTPATTSQCPAAHCRRAAQWDAQRPPARAGRQTARSQPSARRRRLPAPARAPGLPRRGRSLRACTPLRHAAAARRCPPISAARILVCSSVICAIATCTRGVTAMRRTARAANVRRREPTLRQRTEWPSSLRAATPSASTQHRRERKRRSAPSEPGNHARCAARALTSRAALAYTQTILRHEPGMSRGFDPGAPRGR